MKRRPNRPVPKQRQLFREVYEREAAALKRDLLPQVRMPIINEDEVTIVAVYATAAGKVERQDVNDQWCEFEYVDLRVYTVPNGTRPEWPE